MVNQAYSQNLECVAWS